MLATAGAIEAPELAERGEVGKCARPFAQLPREREVGVARKQESRLKMRFCPAVFAKAKPVVLVSVRHSAQSAEGRSCQAGKAVVAPEQQENSNGKGDEAANLGL